MEKKKYFTVYRMAVVGLMSALVFACTFIHIDVPVPMSNKVMIHFGNIMSLLSALLFGPVTGGLSAGLGSAIYDLTDPVYAPEAWITFLMKFAMAWTAGMIAHSGKAHGEQKGKNILAAVCGAGTYVVLYGCKTLVMQRFVMGRYGRRYGRWSSVNAASLFSMPCWLRCARWPLWSCCAVP